MSSLINCVLNAKLGSFVSKFWVLPLTFGNSFDNKWCFHCPNSSFEMNFEEIHFHRSFVNPLSQCGGFDYPKNYTLIFYSFYVPHSFILNLSVKSSCKSFVKLLSAIGGSDRHISCTTRSYLSTSQLQPCNGGRRSHVTW